MVTVDSATTNASPSQQLVEASCLAPQRSGLQGALFGVPEGLHVDRGATRLTENVTIFQYDQPTPPAHFQTTAVCVCLVGQGAARAQVGGRSYLCGNGAYIVKAWVVDGFETEIVEASEGMPFIATMVEFRVDEIASALSDIEAAYPGVKPRSQMWAPTAYVRQPSGTMGNLVSSLLSCATAEPSLERTLLLPLRRRELLYRLLAPLLTCSAQDTGEDVEPPVPAAVNLRPAIELLAKDLSIPLRVADLARAVNMSQSRFAHVFKDVTGVSPHRFRKQLRLEHAKYLLDERSWGVSAVAAEVGYTNVSHFISEFKRIFGTTPGSYTGRG